MKQDMSTTYGIKKQVTRLMAGSSHTLSLLMSMLRVSLEAAWSMAGVWLEYAYSIFITRLRLTHSEITAYYIHAPDAHIRKRQCVGRYH